MYENTFSLSIRFVLPLKYYDQKCHLLGTSCGLLWKHDEKNTKYFNEYGTIRYHPNFNEMVLINFFITPKKKGTKS